MRWMRYASGGSVGVGWVTGTSLQPIESDHLLAVVQGEPAVPRGKPLPLEGLQCLAPLRPSKIIAVGQNYRDHCREQGIAPPARPILFAKLVSSVIGPGEPIRWPHGLTGEVDYEAELAVVIGRRSRRLTPQTALASVFGYTAANDVSARDLQFGDGQWVRGKSLDTFCPLGPVLVSADEIPDPQALAIRCRLNGVAVQDSRTSEMIFGVAELLAFITQGITLEPGDVVLTGTPHGVGKFREPPLFLKPGDLVEVEIGGLGTLTNPIGPYFPDGPD
jgi:2-keto-4-pentenoate hydratase/2-oxohepta-3-ene-1,7-dioic acid hydratase in catechol pathway